MSIYLFILWAVGKSVTCWEEIRCSHLHKSPNQMGQLGVVSIQHHRAEVFLYEDTLYESGKLRLSSTYITVASPPSVFTRLPQPGWQSWAATIHKLMVWCPSYCSLADDPFFVRTTARHTARVRERRHTQMLLKIELGCRPGQGIP